ncbi:hypothetical protein C5167_031019 [Papaver somniferum]|nr:hypothetical protein C5167_031019 [Papaver somniferum]
MITSELTAEVYLYASQNDTLPQDHKKVVRVCQHQAASHWDLSKECEEVQNLVKESWLYPLVENYVKYDYVTINCFVDRYHGETDTMHFPFGEMTLILDDAQNILVLCVIGKVVRLSIALDLWQKKVHAIRIVIQRQFTFRLPRLSSVSGSNLRRKMISVQYFKNKSAPDTDEPGSASPRSATSWYNKYLDQVLMRNGEAESQDDK